MKIGLNTTRYASADLQALIDALIVEKGRGRFTPAHSGSRRGGQAVLDVAYWTGNPAGYRHGVRAHPTAVGSAVGSGGPWYTNDPRHSKTDRLLILSPRGVEKTVGALDALAGITSGVLTTEARDQVAVFLAHFLGLRALGQYRGRSGSLSRTRVDSHVRLISLVAALPTVKALDIRILTRAEGKGDETPESEKRAALLKTYASGSAITSVRDAQRMLEKEAKRVVEHYKTVEAQRARLEKRGLPAEPYTTPTEFLRGLIARIEAGTL
jgi:hypothetical protein